MVAKMAAGDLKLRTLEPGTIFVTDSAFYGLPEDSKQACVCDANSEVTVTEVTGAALAQSSELCEVVLRGLLVAQMASMKSYVQGLDEKLV